MGTMQSTVTSNPTAIGLTTSLLLVGGIYYYIRYYNKQGKTRCEEDICFNIVPAELKKRQNDQGKYSREKINRQFKNAKDDRHKVVTNSTLGKTLIMQCIGRVVACNQKRSEKNKSRGEGSTGTVFAAKDGYFLVITCAHSFVSVDALDQQLKPAKYVYFDRIETFSGGKSRKKPERKKTYNGRKLPWKGTIDDQFNYEKFSVLKGKNKYAARDACPNDIAILAFEDSDGYYKELFTKHKPQGATINFVPVTEIPKDVVLTYHVYGYPQGEDELAEKNGVKRGELWGMRSQSFGMVEPNPDNDEDGNEEKAADTMIPKYVQKNDKVPAFYYNAIDTECGQSGSAIYLHLPNGIYAIVGVHTSGLESRNFGVALTIDKMKELLAPWGSNDDRDDFVDSLIYRRIKSNQNENSLI